MFVKSITKVDLYNKYKSTLPLPFKSLVVLWFLLVTIQVQSVFSRPFQEDSSKSHLDRSTPIYDDVQMYLMKFGYLPQSDFESHNLRSEDQLRDALRSLQKIGNIPTTGKMDTATKQLMRKPRCGVSDENLFEKYRRKRYSLYGEKWNHSNITWSLRKNNFSRTDHGWVRSDLRKALNVWSKHAALNFHEVNSDSADILVFFEKGYHGDGFAFDGPGSVLGHAFSPGSGRGGDVHFDAEEEWLLNGKESKQGTSLFMVAAHEFGHALGLSHSSVDGSLMFPWYHKVEPGYELPDDDRIGIQVLYGSKVKQWADILPYKPPSSKPNLGKITPTTRTTTTTTTAIPRTTSVSPRRIPQPNFCNTTFDSVSVIRTDTFFFKGQYTWRLGAKGLYNGYPALINRQWKELPEDMNHVDAVYERQNGEIVFFIGRQFYVFHGMNLVLGYPKPLTVLGLPEELDHVDAAFVWGHNSKTYIFSGTMYWKYDDNTDRMELDYPRDLSIWKGIGYDINAAFQWHDGATYFFKNREFWKFNDLQMRVDRKEPRSIGPFWFNCTAVNGENRPGRRDKDRLTDVKLGTKDVDEPVSATVAAGGHVPLLLSLTVSLAVAVVR